MTKKHYPYIDVIRVLSMFSVIILHSAVYGLRSNYFSRCWWVLNVLTALCTCAVPLFFMISGALILSSDKTDDYIYIIKKRLPHLILPLVFWSVACVARDFYYNDYMLYGHINNETLRDTILKGLGSPVAVHLWFMYSLIPLYILAPFIRKIAANKKLCYFYICLWLIACTLKSVYNIVPEDIKIYFNIDLFNKVNLVDGYLGYFLLGYLLHNKNKPVKVGLGVFSAVTATGIIAAGTFIFTKTSGEYRELFKSYTGILVIGLSTVLYLLAINIKDLPRALSKVLSYLSSISLGVYMSGNFFLGIMRYKGLTFDGSKGFVLCCIYTFVLCFVFNSLCRLIKPLRIMVVGGK